MEEQQVKPKKRFYKRWWFWLIVVFVLTVIIAAANGGNSDQTSSTQAATSTQSGTQSATSTAEAQLKSIAASVFKGETNDTNEEKLQSTVVNPNPDGGYDVVVTFNADGNLTNKLTLEGIESDMSDLYIAFYTSGLTDVQSVTAIAYRPLQDQYGNVSDKMVYQSRLTKDVADKVNWQADKSTLEVQILPGLWQTVFVSPALQS